MEAELLGHTNGYDEMTPAEHSNSSEVLCHLEPKFRVNRVGD